jgi:murein DD-endopeptidase MepM/ murein hydrolase activator NlpD
MMARALFFVVGILVGVVAVITYLTINPNVSFAPKAQLPLPVPTVPAAQAPPPKPATPAPLTPQPTYLAPEPVPVPATVAPITANPESAPPAANLLLPVLGIKPSELTDTFNQTRGGTRIHEALDIMAPRGREVVAIDDGKIVKLFTSKPGGLTLYQFDTTERFAYYYAHLDRYAPGIIEGKFLKRGELLGYVGSTGNANPDGPHLHFAIFELGPEKHWWQGKPINPYPLLSGKPATN